jgi:DNA-binding transcriptional MocR family regulator
MNPTHVDAVEPPPNVSHSPDWPFRPHVRTIENNILREILKVTDQPGVISFAGGMPAPELFPYEGLLECARELLGQRDGASLQYSLSRGTHELRRYLADTIPSPVPLTEDDVLVTSGSQQALDIVGRAFLEPGDKVITTHPTYVGVIHCFNFYQAEFVTCKTDDEGIDPDAAEAVLRKQKVKLIYLVPSFDNPTGRTMPLERRRRMVELAEKYGVPIIDDNPYGQLRYDGEQLPALRQLSPEWAIELGSFSKIISPGLRIGWLVSPRGHVAMFEKVKQSTDLHTNTFCQRLIHIFCTSGKLEPHVAALRREYKYRRNVMLENLSSQMPDGVKWTRPEGGLFLWVTMPESADAEKILDNAVEQKVAFVPGRPFYPKSDVRNNFRLNFSNQADERIVEGIARLGTILKTQLSGIRPR